MDTHPTHTSGAPCPSWLALRGARAVLVTWPADILDLSDARQELGRRPRRLWT